MQKPITLPVSPHSYPNQAQVFAEQFSWSSVSLQAATPVLNTMRVDRNFEHHALEVRLYVDNGGTWSVPLWLEPLVSPGDSLNFFHVLRVYPERDAGKWVWCVERDRPASAREMMCKTAWFYDGINLTRAGKP